MYEMWMCCFARESRQRKRWKRWTFAVASKIFLILGCILQGWLLIPLAWCLPITISICGKMKRDESTGSGLKVCALLFVNLIGGILLLCRSDNCKG